MENILSCEESDNNLYQNNSNIKKNVSLTQSYKN